MQFRRLVPKILGFVIVVVVFDLYVIIMQLPGSLIVLVILSLVFLEYPYCSFEIGIEMFAAHTSWRTVDASATQFVHQRGAGGIRLRRDGVGSPWTLWARSLHGGRRHRDI